MLPRTFLASRFAALLAAALIGMAESTGLAPPPPIMFEEEIEWIAPGGEEDADLPFGLAFDSDENDDADSGVLGVSERDDPGWLGSHLSRLLKGLRYRS